MAEAPGNRAQDDGRGLLKSPLDFGAGIFLIGLAAIGFIGAFTLPFGHLSGIGSGLLPKSVAVLVGIFGALLVLQSLLIEGDRLERWGIRGPIFVIGAVILFALTIRTLGLVVAGPLCVVVSALADRDTRPVELVIFAVVLTAACIALFKFMLRLPIPIFPPGYGPF